MWIGASGGNYSLTRQCNAEQGRRLLVNQETKKTCCTGAKHYASWMGTMLFYYRKVTNMQPTPPLPPLICIYICRIVQYIQRLWVVPSSVSCYHSTLWSLSLRRLLTACNVLLLFYPSPNLPTGNFCQASVCARSLASRSRESRNSHPLHLHLIYPSTACPIPYPFHRFVLLRFCIILYLRIRPPSRRRRKEVLRKLVYDSLCSTSNKKEHDVSGSAKTEILTIFCEERYGKAIFLAIIFSYQSFAL